MDLSLIICTRNRAGSLGRCLDSVAQLQFDKSWEFVLVDNGSTDETRTVVEAWAAAAPMPLRYVHEAVPGLSKARNAGLRAARGEIIAFTDDDCYPAPDFLLRTMAAFEDTRLGFVSGRIMLHDPTDYPATINESTVPLRFPAGRYLAPGAIKGANLSFRRAALDQAKWFDPQFGSGALFPSEDIDTAARVARYGWDGAYDPSIVVSHHHGRKAADIGSLHKAYAIGRGAYHMKLLVADRSLSEAFTGWKGIMRRTLARPSDLRWELAGAWRWLMRPRTESLP
ncbi:glycosyltransferase [Sphingobium xenophagum]|uniref:Glycosyltransferase 2-like domain-containing protein n=1 Tax=Sphingobium xenophagum TaxID=121428 RepID=A0A401J6B8_SPHXE|nr:glycosyltransferase family A protein [Sphingobium xenophagum]GBH32186.1 hypothetical protein MBESOW_P3425 [Sphingobium xenophagum]